MSIVIVKKDTGQDIAIWKFDGAKLLGTINPGGTYTVSDSQNNVYCINYVGKGSLLNPHKSFSTLVDQTISVKP